MGDILACYYRTSLEDYDRAHGMADQSQSIENQRKLVTEYLQKNQELSRFHVVEFFDDGLTGTNTDRPQFQAMIGAARRGEVRCIVIKDLSRFGRSYLDVGDYLEHIFPFLGVRIIAINDGYDSRQHMGRTGGMDVAFRNFIYENYSRDLSVKVRSAMHARMREGRFVNHVPYGYQKDPRDKHKMVPDEKTAPIVREIFLSVIEGKSTSEIAKELNSRGVLTPLEYKKHRLKPQCQNRELMWAHTTVLNILNNYKYTGAMTNHTKENKYMRDRNQRRVPREEWIITENTHEAIVSKDEFEAAHGRIRAVKKHEHGEPKSYDRVFYCGHCGRKLRKSFGLDTYFACDTHLYQKDAACAGIRWSKTDLEAVLLPIYESQLYLLGEKAACLSAGAELSEAEDYEGQLSKIDQEISSCNAQKIQYYESYRSGKFDRDTFAVRKAALETQIQELRDGREKVNAEYQRRRKEAADTEQTGQELKKYLSAAGSRGDERKAAMYKAIDRAEIFSDQHVEIRWKFDDLFQKKNRV